MIIDWKEDYQGEFICPNCKANGMKFLNSEKRDFNLNGARFSCLVCNKTCGTDHILKIIAVSDPTNLGITWYTTQKIQHFICPDCKSENMYFLEIDFGTKKKRFLCKTCRKKCSESASLRRANISRRSQSVVPVKSFNWKDSQWDLRSINPNFDKRDNYTVDFTEIKPDWLNLEAKKYIQHLCKLGNTFSTIIGAVSAIRIFSRYLIKTNTITFEEINRSLILDYLAQEQKVTKAKLGGLRKFFMIGSMKDWFNIDQDIIRDTDYPKQYRGNPDPISDRVREQIEQNLHQIPDPIARMWLIGYFSAMRPSELALLKKDCLVQEGQHWKLVWHRKKTNDYHEIPISRTIAKVVQEQQEYIQNLWGDDWEYLFCHYHNLSSGDVSQLNLEPIKKVLPNQTRHPLMISICTLIRVLNICDENGQLAKFQPRLLRPTCLSELFKKGHDLAVVSAWAGHKHLATTSTYYTQVSCNLMESEAGHIHQALVNIDGHHVRYESFPKSFWENPTAHKLELGETHINTPIYGLCGLPLDQDCNKFRACLTCQCFVATIDKLPQYIDTRDKLRAKESKAMSAGQEVLVEQFSKQADQLDKIITSFQQEVA